MTGKRGLAAVLPIGVRQHSVYQRRTPLSERRRHRTASVPAVSFTRPGGIWKMSVPPGGVEHVRPLQETRKRLAVLTVADEAEAAGRRDVARHAAHTAAPAAKREVQRQACHVNASDHESAATRSLSLSRFLRAVPTRPLARSPVDR